MKTTLSFLFLLCFHYALYAQNYIPTVEKGKIWHIYHPVGMGQYIPYNTKIECDTSIELIQYNNVYLCDSFGNAYCKVGSIREDMLNHKVYFVDTGSVTENVIFDYDLIKGDNFGLFTVDTVTAEIVYGQQRKVIYFDQLYKWIEGLGASFFGVYDLYGGYSQIDTVVKFNSNCMPLSVKNAAAEKDVTLRYQGNLVYINTSNDKNKRIEIINSLGQMLFQSKFTGYTIVDISHFSKQMLILHIYDLQEHFIQRIITQ